MIVEVTRDHVKRARQLYIKEGLPVSCVCPVSLALCEALRVDAQDNIARYANGDDGAVWSTATVLHIAGREIPSPAPVAALVDWFDTVGAFYEEQPPFARYAEPEWPVRFELPT